jgi:hypothetical protein
MKSKLIVVVMLIAAMLPAWAGGYATHLLGNWTLAESESVVREMTFRNDKTFTIRLYTGEQVTGTYGIERYGQLAMALDSSPDIPVGATILLSPDNNQLTIRYRRHEQHFIRVVESPRARLANLR